MSTSKILEAVDGNDENVDSTKDMDKKVLSNVTEEEDGKTNAVSESTTAAVQEEKGEAVKRASTPTQKELSKVISGVSGVVNSSGRVTRNSPLLISPNSKKEQQGGGDSEPANSESEDGGQAKKQIRGRKSIKEAKESAVNEQPNEIIENKSIEELVNSKEECQTISTEYKDLDQEKSLEVLKENEECNVNDKEKECTKDNLQEDLEETQVKDCKKTPDTKEPETLNLIKDYVQNNDKVSKDSESVKEKEEISKDAKENKDKDIIKDSKETKEKDLKETAAVTNRLTRNAVAQEVASKSRVTRNRQMSANSASRPETPPTARRGRPPANAARKPAETAVAQKRKRSVEEVMDLPLAKLIKIEPKEINESHEDDDSSISIPTSTSGNTDLEGVRIKQEMIESDDAASTTNESAISTTTTVTTTTSTRGRGNRWTGRKPTQTISPSTRSTRQNKVASPVTAHSPVPERKRRRTAGTNNKRGSSLLKSSVAGPATATTGASVIATPDEDSKDSLASSMDDIALADIKFEKLTPELEENLDVEMETKKTCEEEANFEDITDSVEQKATEPLTVTTETPIIAITKEVNEETTRQTVEATTSTLASCLNKDSSLSPELVSEGVSEISVKQFYNRPKFLENNLGIEEDPKLGEIVQKATTSVIDQEIVAPQKIVSENIENGKELEDNCDVEASGKTSAESNNPLDESFSTESMKEGDLVYEESIDGKKSPDVKAPETDLTPIVENVQQESVVQESDQSTKVAAEDEIKQDEEDTLEERLVMVEEDLDEDDVTIEESETISMDNNPSLHDDAQEDEDDHDTEENCHINERTNDVNENDTAVVKDNEAVDEITNKEIKQTSNQCDIEEAKLTEEEARREKEVKKAKATENDKEILKVVNESLERQNEKEKEKMEEKQIKVHKKKEENDTSLKNDTKSAKGDTSIKDKSEKNKIKSIIVTKFDSDEKEPMQYKEQMNADVRDVEKTEISKLLGQERRISTTNPAQLMEVDDLKDDEENIKKEHQSAVEEMDISENSKSEKISSTSNTPIKSSSRCQRESKDEDVSSIKSPQSTTDTNSWTTIEPDCDDEEKLRLKEQHLKNLGLLTHKAAEKRRQEFIQTAAAIEATRAAAAATVSHHHSKRNGNKSTSSGNFSNSGATSHEYTGTLKTVIKLNRNSSGTAVANTTAVTVTTASTSNGSSSSGRKSHITNSKDNNTGVRRQSLKMTFQKGRGRGHATHGNDRTGNTQSGTQSGDNSEQGEDSYYTIQNENEGVQKHSSGSSLSNATASTKDQQTQKQHLINNNTSNVQMHGRKSYNSRSNISNSHNQNQNHHFTKNSSHIDSSHSEGHHDGITNALPHTSVNIISHKKDDREEILIPEKASSFKFHPGRLCEDQCYYCSGKFGLYDTPCHVGQIKSVERQQKILQNEEKLTVDNCLCDACFRHVDRRANVPSYKKRLSASGHLENINSSIEGHNEDGSITTNAEETEGARKCVVPDCGQAAPHSLRRRCIRKSVKKFLLNFDMPTGTPYIWLCQSHYNAVIQCSGCVLCKRRLGKNHMYHITSDTERLEKALTDMGIPVQLGIGTAVCKLCRYFANLLMKPPDSTKSQKAEFVKNYRKRLLQFHNIHDGSNNASDADEDENCQNSTIVDDASAQDSKTPTKRRINKEKVNINSPTASSSSSVICITETTVEKTPDKSQNKSSSLVDNEEVLEEEYETSAQISGGETSHENSKSPIPQSPDEDNDKQNSRLKAILQSGDGNNKSKQTAKSDLPCALLRANPNLSMRELFPGEEDLGLNFKAPFGSSNSQRTPEGWTRVQTFLQYDEPTRRLWEELQKPYGNQSSFLRHLILLEKYYRNGDLVLSANASSNASVYTQTVRQRLDSFDQGHCGGLDESILNKLSSQPATKDSDSQKPDIPLVEINDDEEDVNKNGTAQHDEPSNAQKSSKLADDDDDDVIMEEVPSSAEKTPAKRRTRSVSVDKLTRQLSSNAVTIIARPREPAQNASTNPNKSSGVGDGVQKRAELPKLTPTNSHNDNNASCTIAPLNPSVTATLTTSTTPSIMASPSNNNSNSSNSSTSSSSSSNTNSNSRSILKSNLLGITNNKSVEILPITSQKSAGIANTVTATTVNIPSVSLESTNSNIRANQNSSSSNTVSSKQQKILEVANKLRESQMEAAAKQQNTSTLTSPPELVSLQRRNASHAANPAGSAGVNTSSNMSSTTASLINAKRPHLMGNRSAGHSRGSGSGHAPNVVILPNTLSAHERAESKSWRPTLMSVEDNQHLLNKNGPLYQTADGRRLPGLVQVQSGGKPFLISIFDYNRMCILRREKLMRDGMVNSGKQKSQQQQQRHGQQSSHYNKMNSNNNNSGNNNSNQNSSNNNISSGSGSSSSAKHQAQANAVQQQFMQMLQFQKQQQQQQQQQQQAAAMKAANNPNNSRYHPIAPKPSSLNSNSSTANLMSVNNGNAAAGNAMNLNNASNNSRLAGNPANFPMPLLANALSNANAAAAAAAAAASINNPWLWSNFPDAHELLRNGVHGLNKLPPLLPKPSTSTNANMAKNLAPPATITSKQLQQHQQQQQQQLHHHHQQQQQHQMLLDNTLMSKIPKSLTVIPQHKLMGSGSNSNSKE